ncbi:MAG TPA: NAD-dependent epimerase/dehydratase family protein [Burkholderiales bacterium]|nr:NAD-dependent epimerase/dehydratase family protein [Burkholderiales bacterium]
MKALVTGATGFIGRHLVRALLSQGARVSVVTRDERKARSLWPSGLVSIHTADLARGESLASACRDVTVVFHLAGYAHAVDEDDGRSAAHHEAVTVEGTRTLLADALCGSVERIVYASSVKAMGEGGDDCLDETSPVQPRTVYGRSRLAAETMLLDAHRHNRRFDAVVVRFPLVYGRGNEGNLMRMIAAVDRGRFPPLPPLHNRRSMVCVDDAVQGLLLAAQSPQAGGKVYLITDGNHYSTDQIYTCVRNALGKPALTWHVPMLALRALACAGDVIGKLRGRPWIFDRVALSKLIGSACYLSDRMRRDLGFRPSRTLIDALPEMVDDYRSRRTG